MVESGLTSQEILNAANTLYFHGHAQEALEKAMELNEDVQLRAASLRLQSACYFKLNQLDLAKKTLTELINPNNNNLEDYYNLAHIDTLLQEFDEAEKLYKKIVTMDPKPEKASLLLADIYIKKGDTAEAIILLKNILETKPSLTAAEYKLALINEDKEKIATSLKKMSKQKPLDPDIKLNLAKWYLDQADFKNAIYYVNEAISVGGNTSLSHYFAGLQAYATKLWNQATINFTTALNSTPDQPEIHYALSKNYLTQGIFKEGWKAWSWHTKLPTEPEIYAIYSKNKIPFWHGEDLKNKHLLIFANTTYGNTFLFLRYLKAIPKDKTHITLMVPENQVAVINKLHPDYTVIPFHKKLPTKINYVVPLLLLPEILNLDYGTPLSDKKHIKKSHITQIGLCWKQESDPSYKDKNLFDCNNLTPLVKSINANFVCLHPHLLSNEERDWCIDNNIIFPSKLNKLENLLEEFSTLDLIISTDHDIAHLAASLNYLVYVLVPYTSSHCWYFGTEKNSTPWYPSMHLFRQAIFGHWSNAVVGLTQELIKHAKASDYKYIYPEAAWAKKLKDLNSNKQYEECIKEAKKALAEFPEQSAYLFYLGSSAANLKDDELALSSLLHAKKLNENNSDIWTNLGTIYHRLNMSEKAIECFTHAIEFAPKNADNYKNLAITYFDLGFPEKSLELYRKSLELRDTAVYHFGYSLQLLGMGLYEEGWREYEYRLKMPQHNYNYIKLNTPLWNGCDLTNKTLFLLSEQGIGDNIQFLRFIKLIKQRYFCKIIFGCTTNLLRLAKQIKDLDVIVCEGDGIPPHDYHLPLMSLAMYFKLYKKEQMMGDIPYLNANPVLVNYWEQFFKPVREFKVGFCWSGNPAHVHNARRNCDLFDFIKLLQNTKIRLYSLQKNITEEEKTMLETAGIANLGDMFDDLDDTAAAITQLDVVLSIDSALAHLAGALGKETWLLLSYYSEWRHPRNLPYSPWYKEVKFYQQIHPGDWNSVFNRVELDLNNRTGVSTLTLEKP